VAGLTAVVISYNSAKYLKACLTAALRWADEVIVVDNASRDDSVAVAKTVAGIHVIENLQNRGFAGGANQGIEKARHEVVLLLNPDVELIEGIERLREAVMREGYGAAAGVLTDANRRTQTGFSVRRLPTVAALVFEVLGINRLWPSNAVNRRWRCLDLDLELLQDVEQPAGAFLAIRRTAWREIGRFDESFYPVWFEDVDFCQRLGKSRRKIALVPEARAVHAGGHSVGQMEWADREVQWYVSLLKYAAKHFGLFGRVMIATALGFAAVPRAVLGILQRRSFEPARIWKRLVWISVQSLQHRG
jgi:N-acetylglucosaminyl-diphospho-decaprenol L-rhamnosyltransferase